MEILTSAPVRPAQTRREGRIHWKQLWSLAALYASVIIGWIAYQNYQPRLLVQFSFTDFTFLLMAAQGIIIVITPLIAGRLGDRYRFEKGHRLPIITSGISFAAMIFMAVAFTLLANPGEIFRWVLPLLIVFWLVAMSIFTSPALSTLELFTPVDKLPHAMAILTIAGSLVYSLEPVIINIIDYLGPPITFMTGGVAVFLSGYALKKHSLGLFKLTNEREALAAAKNDVRSPYAFIFFLGLCMGLATTFLFYFVPDFLDQKQGRIFQGDNNVMVAGMLFFSAMISWPVSHVVSRYGTKPIFFLSMALLVATAGGLYLATATEWILVVAAGYALAFTALSVSALPMAIRRASLSEKVFCVGVFFSGAAVPEGFWEAFQVW